MKTPTAARRDLSAHGNGAYFCASNDVAHSADAEILVTNVGRKQQTHTENMMNLFVWTV